MKGNFHVRCGAGEKPAITSKAYLSLFKYDGYLDDDDGGCGCCGDYPDEY